MAQAVCATQVVPEDSTEQLVCLLRLRLLGDVVMQEKVNDFGMCHVTLVSYPNQVSEIFPDISPLVL